MRADHAKLFGEILKLTDNELREFLCLLNLEIHLRLMKELKAKCDDASARLTIVKSEERNY